MPPEFFDEREEDTETPGSGGRKSRMLRLPPELDQDMRVVAAYEGISVNQLMRDTIRDHVARELPQIVMGHLRSLYDRGMIEEEAWQKGLTILNTPSQLPENANEPTV